MAREFESDERARLEPHIATFFEAPDFIRSDPGPFPWWNAATASTARISLMSPAGCLRSERRSGGRLICLPRAATAGNQNGTL
jgi:hypothetical protein